MDSLSQIVCETVKAELERQIPPYIAAADALKKRVTQLEAENVALKKELAKVEKREDTLTVLSGNASSEVIHLRETIEKAIAAARAFSQREQVGNIGERIVDIIERALTQRSISLS